MTVVYADFTAAFPEFANAATYPQTQVDFWLTQAGTQLSSDSFGASYDLATMLYVAHNIALSAKAARAGSGVGDVGVVTSKSVGSVSKSLDTHLTATDGAGFWNATSYGQRLYKMMQTYCTGPFYVVDRNIRPIDPFLTYFNGGFQ